MGCCCSHPGGQVEPLIKEIAMEGPYNADELNDWNYRHYFKTILHEMTDLDPKWSECLYLCFASLPPRDKVLYKHCNRHFNAAI